ncbi:MAG: sigma-54-dependent Fis family transcriptional regulator [Deltaproteobacteria bacterium]|nr:sigma-54-dependent Fis family transcriptional regulator [Deltaproteobacteria bacterium]
MKLREHNKRPCSVLLVDDERTILVSLRDSLRDAEIEVVTASTGDEALRLLRNGTFGVVVSDVRMPGLSGLELLAKIRDEGIDAPVILMTAYATIDQAVAAMKTGAYDYVTKPFPNEKVVRMVQNAWALVSLRAEVRDLRAQRGTGLEFLVGTSAPWARVLDKVWAVAATDSTVLIVGPSGTGKEMVANALHLLSRRKDGPFIKVHCAALPDSLIENELFGHEKGAFTGAVAEVKGRFELAHGGTLLLDEVDDIPLNVQVKLLRVIQERVIERLGGGKPIPVDVRLLVTSKGRLEDLVEQGTFRQDLYYRLSVVQLHLPRLAERRDDIPLLLEHFLALCSHRMMRACGGFTPEALAVLTRYDYPGNVRELEHIVESCCALSSGGPIGTPLLPDRVRERVQNQPALPRSFNGQPLQEAIDEFERSYLETALREFEGKRAELADRLGISRKTLWEKLKKHGLVAE